jgi:hypothetical protein
MLTARGQCPVCRGRFRLRKDSTVAPHLWRSSGQPERGPECAGSRQPAVPFDPNTCPVCMEHRFEAPGLMEACCSLAIESRAAGKALMWDYLVAYHEAGHQ